MTGETPTQISRDDLMRLPMTGYDGTITLVEQDEQMPAAIAALRREALLGFDTESKPVFVRGVTHPPSLVQLAGEVTVCIFQLRKVTNLAPLLDLLADGGIRKVGVAIADDIRKLRDYSPFEPAGFVEISTLARSVGFQQTGLRPLAGLLLNCRISKREQRSNWARDTLSPSQVRYAATDAWVSREIYRRLEMLQLQRREESLPLGSARETMA